MDINKNEVDARTVWRKYLRHENGEGFMTDGPSVGVFCIREVSGYAVWYCRWLKDEQAGQVASVDGDYLLRFFAPGGKHEAIEFAVLSTSPGAVSEVAVAHLDGLAKHALLLDKKASNIGPFEIVN